MNTTDEYWDIDGSSLNVPGWNLSTLGGRFTVPPLRGEDTTCPYVPGDQHGDYVPGSRVLTFNMWLAGADRSSGALNVDQRRAWNDNWKYLTRLFWTPKREFVVTRRLWLTDPDAETDAGVIQTTTARGFYSAGLDAQMTGRTRATFTVDVKLADPFFYGPVVETTIDVADPEVITNPGDFDAGHRNISVVLHGPLTNPTLTNSTPDPDVWVKYLGSLDTGKTLTLNIEAFTAIASAPPDIAIPEYSLNRGGYISHGGAHNWMGLVRGTNTLTLTADSGAGHAVVRFQPPYL